MCFHASTPFDIVWSEAKGVGSAQRRTGGRVLHHGSIKLGASALEAGVATLDLAARRVDVAALITHRLGLDEVGEGFRLTAAAGESLKIIVDPTR